MNVPNLIFLPVLFLFIVSGDSVSAKTDLIQTNDVTVFYEQPLTNAAQEVSNAYPAVKAELTEKLLWQADFRPEIVLVKGRDQFRKIAGNDLIVAFAVPGRNLIVLDTSSVYTRPFTLEATLKHELCHLLLHHNIENERLPRWLDEGVCQWATGGIAELMAGEEGKALSKSVMSDRLIDIKELDRFPVDEKSLVLAYEESRSFVEYIDSEFGKQRLLNILEYLKEGKPINEAVQGSLSIDFLELEKKWHAYLKRKYTWFSYFSNNIYTILFSLAAAATVYGFIRLIKKKRGYKDEEDEED